MGRITIFTLDDCIHCKRTKIAFEEREIPYYEISLSYYPHRRNDMLTLADALTVPQVFFNETHIGGGQETIELLNQWDNNHHIIVNNNALTTATTTTAAAVEEEEEKKSSEQYSIASNSSSSSRNEAIMQLYENEIGNHPDPTDERLRLISSKDKKMRKEAEEDDDDNEASYADNEKKTNYIDLPNGCSSSSSSNKTISVLQMIEKLKQILPRRTIKHKWKKYKFAFTGKELIHMLCNEYNIISITQAMEFASKELLQKYSIIHHVNNDDNHYQQKYIHHSNDYYYRLHCDHTPSILNSYRKWIIIDDKTTGTTNNKDVMKMLKRNNKLLSSIINDCTTVVNNNNNSDTNNNDVIIQYKKAQQHEKYPIFEEAICELQVVDLGLLDENTKMAFGINVYNLMIKYAFIKVGIAITNIQRTKFFTHVQFNIGGHNYSLNDWEHGILRGNQKPPYCIKPQFTKTDPRYQYRVQSDDVDCRIHFALNCGAKSCPPIKSYTAHSIHEELRIVAQSFLEDDNNIQLIIPKGNSSNNNNSNSNSNNNSHSQIKNYNTNTIECNKILYWYKSDFENKNKGGNIKLQDTILKLMRDNTTKKVQLQQMIKENNNGKPLNIVYKPYDWTVPYVDINNKEATMIYDYTKHSKPNTYNMFCIFQKKP